MRHWLALDVGNTAAKAGLFKGETLARAFVLPEDPAQWSGALSHACAGASRPERAGLACVVPARAGAARETLRRLTGTTPLTVSPDLNLPFALDYHTPETLGADRLAAAIGGWAGYGAAERGIVVVDAGTAVTYEVVDAQGVFRGGAIAPGPPLQLRALRDGTAQLPDVPLERPLSPVGRSTREAMQAGLLYGLLDSVGGMIERLRAVIADPVIIATGGWSALLDEQLAAVHHVDPHLVLRGVRVLMARNR